SEGLKLQQQRRELISHREALKAKIDEHDDKEAPEGSSEEQDLRRQGDELRTALQQHIDKSNHYNETVRFYHLLNGTSHGTPLNAILTNSSADRSAFNYARVIDQFKV